MTARVLAALGGMVGVLVLAGCGLGPLKDDSLVVTAQFRDAAGLYVGNDVRVLGLPVGEVLSIEPRGGHVEVRLELSRTVSIPADATAVTVAPSVVTDRHVEMVPAWTAGPTMQDGAVIPLERTRTPVELDQVVRAAKALADALDEQGGDAPIRDMMRASTDLLGGNGARFRQMLDSAARLTEAGLDNRDDLAGLVRGLDQLVGAAARNDKRIRSFSERVTVASELFADEAPHLRRTLRQALKLLREADGLLKENRAQVRRSLKDFATTADTVAGRSREVTETTDLLPLLLDNAARAIDPETGALRAHGLGLDSLLQGELFAYMCPFLPFLPQCRTEVVR